MANQNAHDPATPVPASVAGVDTSDIAADHVTVTDLFVAVINPVAAGSVQELYAEAAAALAEVTATELLDEPDTDRLIRAAVVALQDGAGALLALAKRCPVKDVPRRALAAALQAHAADTLQALDCAHIVGR
jgi:hypothetical protein